MHPYSQHLGTAQLAGAGSALLYGGPGAGEITILKGVGYDLTAGAIAHLLYRDAGGTGLWIDTIDNAAGALEVGVFREYWHVVEPGGSLRLVQVGAGFTAAAASGQLIT